MGAVPGPLTDLREYDRALRSLEVGALAEVRALRPTAEPAERPDPDEVMYGVGMALVFALAAWVVCGAPLP